LGIHLEGPYLKPARRGAHLKRNLRRPSVREFARYVRAADGLLKMITIAPELPGALDVVREARRAGVIVSIGHSDATREEAVQAFRAGASHVTHIFNAMSPFHHRAAGLAGAALLEPVYIEVIYDRVHVSREAMEIVLRCKDPRRIILASDASPALDAPDGVYAFDGIPAVIRKGRCVTKGSGRLAGSMASLWTCYRNFREDFGGGREFVTANPARLLGIRWTP
jgi:N-acetylglucosamine-6-phosphate deacetylase